MCGKPDWLLIRRGEKAGTEETYTRIDRVFVKTADAVEHQIRGLILVIRQNGATRKTTFFCGGTARYGVHPLWLLEMNGLSCLLLAKPQTKVTASGL